ncbi:MAG: lysophospholipid acyltransferase family protein [Gammaproteobacteria bacterium]
MGITEILITPLRMLLTAYCFIQFAVQVLWLGHWQMPRIMKSGTDQKASRKKALHAAHIQVSAYLKTLSFLQLVKFTFEGQPHKSPCVIVSNHPGLLDIIVFLKDFPNAICLFKSESLDNRVLSSFLKVGGYIEGIDGTGSSNKRIIASSCERLNEGHHMIFFPEGTRSPSATSMRKFRTTAFHTAVKSGYPLQPIAIYCQPLFLGKNQKWSSFSRRTNHMTIRYLPAINIDNLAEDKRNAAGLLETARDSISTALAEMSSKQPGSTQPKNQ